MKHSLMIYLNIVCIAVFLVAAMSTEDILINRLYTALMLLATLNAMRLDAAKHSKTNKSHEKKTGF